MLLPHHHSTPDEESQPSKKKELVQGHTWDKLGEVGFKAVTPDSPLYHPTHYIPPTSKSHLPSCQQTQSLTSTPYNHANTSPGCQLCTDTPTGPYAPARPLLNSQEDPLELSQNMSFLHEKPCKGTETWHGPQAFT